MTHAATTMTSVPQLNLTVTGVLTVDATSKIDVTGKGFLGGYRSGNATATGVTTGNTTADGSTTGGDAGGSHGGRGGMSSATSAAVYDSLTNPTEPGGGGSAHNNRTDVPGGNGGGLIRITAGTIQLDGGIVADGGIGFNSSASGGAGGGIRIDAITISGGATGYIAARGGSSTNGAAGGGGGRIAIYYGSMPFNPAQVVVTGGSSNYSSMPQYYPNIVGSAGTVYLSPRSQTLTITKVSTGTGTITSTPTGISCGATCTSQFTTLSTVTLTATPAPGSTFTGWSGACTGMGTCTVTMDAAKNVTATFAQIPPPTVTITSPSGYTKNNKPLLQYTVSSGTAVVKVDGVALSKVSGNYLDTLLDGSHTVHIEASNAVGTGFADSTFVVDTVAPVLTVNPVTTPSLTASLTLTGTTEAGANLNISANTAATVGPISFAAGTWSCTVSNLTIGSNTFIIKALDQATNSRAVSVTVTYQPTVALALSTTSIAAEYQGTVGITISNINPAASELLIEQLVDVNQNDVDDAGDYVIRSFKVTDGIASTNPNVQGDEDGVANSAITTALNYFLTSDLYHTPGHYLFRATKGTQNSVVPFTVSQVSQSQTVAGMVTDGTNPIAGAMVQLTDKWQRHVAYAVANASGSYVLNIKQPGIYNLLPVAYGYVATTIPVTLAASQNIENLNLSLTTGTYHVTGNVKDATSGTGIAGIWIQASDGNNSGIALTNSSGTYDLLLPSGQYSVNTFTGAFGPSSFAKGYAEYNKQPLTITVNGNMAATDIRLPVGNITATGRVLDITGNPLPGIPVMGKIKGALDNREPVSFGISDASGYYSIGLFVGTNWDIYLYNTLDYLGTVHRDLSTTVGPLSGNDLTVHPVTAWVQGVVKDSTNKLLSGVEVKLRNMDSSIIASVVSARDGSYRLGAFAGNWFIDALTENKGTHPVTEQTFTLVDGQTGLIGFVVDVTPPSLIIDTVTTPTRISSQTVTGSMEIGSTIRLNVNTTASVSLVSYPTKTTWRCDITGLAKGANTITVTATDAAENTTVATSTITIDTIPPTIVISSPLSGITNNQTPVLTFTASDGTIVVKVDNAPVNKKSGNTLDTLSYGTHTVRVEATDAAGNPGFNSVTFTVNRPPVFNPTTFNKANATVGIAYSGQSIAGAAADPDGDAISYSKISGPVWLTVAANGALGGTPVTAANNSFVVRATSTGGTADATLNIKVAAVPAAVAQLNTWANLYSSAPNKTSASNLAVGSFTVGSGSNRLLLVAVVMEIGTAANPIISASYGGVALTRIKITANTQREIVWMGYLKESQIGSGAKALTVTYSGATGNASALHVKWAAFTGVNQTTPIAGSGGVNTATTSATFGSSVKYVTNGMTTVVAGNGGTPATGTLSATPAFIAGTATTTNAQTSRTFITARHTAAGSYASATPMTWTGTASKWSGLAVVSLQP
ncbi:MAG: carboxypeptidase regulatory-like domain-containing protein [Pedobacter sp.]